MEYEHLGTKIVLDTAKARFSATINGKAKHSPSLAGIKSQIEKAQTFEPFVALIPERSGNGYQVGTVTGIERRKGRYVSSEWLTEKGTRTYVYQDTPENRAAIDGYLKANEDEGNRHRTEVARIRLLGDAIVKMKPE